MNTAMLRVVEREARVWSKLWRGSAFTTFVQPALYLAAMGIGLGKLVDAHSGSVGGVSYLEFVAPGLLVASAMQAAATASLWPVIVGAKWMRLYHGVVATPVRPDELYGGIIVWIAVRAMMTAVAFLVVAALLGAIASPLAVFAIPVAALCAAAFAAPISAFSITQETDLSFPMIMRLAVLPLFLFSGTFFPVSQLPPLLRALAVVSPLWHAVELARMATTGNVEPAAAAVHVLVLVACIAIGAWFGVRSFTRRLSA